MSEASAGAAVGPGGAPDSAGAVAFHATGFRHPRLLGLGGEGFTPYDDVIHVRPALGGLRVATRRTCELVPRRAFAGPGEAVRAAALLRQRVASLPRGGERMARMAGLDARLVRPGRGRVALALGAACVAAFLAQWALAPRLEHAGAFSADLLRAGDLWRLVTANFLHGGPTHLLFNALGLLVLGGLLEAIVGGRALAFVMAASALGAMGGSLLADYFFALGASGLVAGAVGALVWIELRRPEVIPAPWRIPRGILLGVVGGDALVLAFVPAVAHAAHAGGFLAGALAAACLFAGGRRAPPAPRWLALAGAVAALGLLLAVAGLAVSLVVPEVGAARRAERLLALDGVRPETLNNEAWMIAISSRADSELLALALRLAEEAVERTARRDPHLLDTLAEVHFAAGRAEEALSTIDEALALAPEATYLREQRRRFQGQREADDRPDPPREPLLPEREPWPERPRPRPEPEPGVRV